MKLEPRRGQINSPYTIFRTKHSSYLHSPSFHVPTFPDLRNSYLPKIRRHLYLSTHMVNYTCTYTSEYTLKPKSVTLEPDRPQHDRPDNCVIAQQYSSSIFFSLRFHSSKGKQMLARDSKMFYFHFFLNFVKNS
jgi:hypothetical protein